MHTVLILSVWIDCKSSKLKCDSTVFNLKKILLYTKDKWFENVAHEECEREKSEQKNAVNCHI